MGGVPLGIKINNQSSLSPGSTDGRKITGNAGFAHTTFLVEYNPPHVVSPIVIVVLNSLLLCRYQPITVFTKGMVKRR
jgi:hypothetical protein